MKSKKYLLLGLGLSLSFGGIILAQNDLQSKIALLNNSDESLPWNLHDKHGLNLRKIWKLNQGEDVVVAVIDSGINFGSILE